MGSRYHQLGRVGCSQQVARGQPYVPVIDGIIKSDRSVQNDIILTTNILTRIDGRRQWQVCNRHVDYFLSYAARQACNLEDISASIR